MLELGLGCLLVGFGIGWWLTSRMAAFWERRFYVAEHRADYFEMWATIYYRETLDLKAKMNEVIEDGDGWKFR